MSTSSPLTTALLYPDIITHQKSSVCEWRYFCKMITENIQQLARLGTSWLSQNQTYRTDHTVVFQPHRETKEQHLVLKSEFCLQYETQVHWWEHHSLNPRLIPLEAGPHCPTVANKWACPLTSTGPPAQPPGPKHFLLPVETDMWLLVRWSDKWRLIIGPLY